jgi:serine/threonine protein kinase
MSPEVQAGKRATPASDVWAAGVYLYPRVELCTDTCGEGMVIMEMCTGEKPDLEQVLSSSLDKLVLNAFDMWSYCSHIYQLGSSHIDLVRAVREALALNPSQRPSAATMRTLIAADAREDGASLEVVH